MLTENRAADALEPGRDSSKDASLFVREMNVANHFVKLSDRGEGIFRGYRPENLRKRFYDPGLKATYIEFFEGGPGGNFLQKSFLPEFFSLPSLFRIYYACDDLCSKFMRPL